MAKGNNISVAEFVGPTTAGNEQEMGGVKALVMATGPGEMSVASDDVAIAVDGAAAGGDCCIELAIIIS